VHGKDDESVLGKDDESVLGKDDVSELGKEGVSDYRKILNNLGVRGHLVSTEASCRMTLGNLSRKPVLDLQSTPRL
jgi:hypothetical protein